MTPQRERIQSTEIGNLPELSIKQIYCRIITKDKKVIIVSKDGSKRQFPGGKPDLGETISQTLNRELYEETGITSQIHNSIYEFFGYYIVNEDQGPYLQLRFSCLIDYYSGDSDLQPHEVEGEADHIKYIESIGINELSTKIPRIENLGEYKYIKSKYN